MASPVPSVYGSFTSSGTSPEPGAAEEKSIGASWSNLSLPSPSPDEIHEYSASEVNEDIDGRGPQVVGSGAYGIVYKARFHGVIVAVKELRTERGAAAEVFREIRMHSKIGPHPNVLTLLGVFRKGEASIPCIITDFMEGGSILNRLCIHARTSRDRSGCGAPSQYAGGGCVNGFGNYHTPDCVEKRPTFTQLVSYAMQAAAGVLHIHKSNTLHRDIACRNLLVDGDRVRVSDFGLSRALNTQADLLYSAVEFGPVPWMAPESLAADASQRSFSTKSDVHMFGVTLFELFTYGAQPWAGLSPLDIVYRVHAGQSVVSQLPADLHPTIAALIENCVRFSRDDRPSMEAVHAKLESLHSELLAYGDDIASTLYTTAFVNSPVPADSTQIPFMKRAKRKIRAIAAPSGAVIGIAAVSLAAVALYRMASAYKPQELDLLKILETKVRDPFEIPPYNPSLAAHVDMTMIPKQEPVLLQLLRMWNKMMPPPF